MSNKRRTPLISAVSGQDGTYLGQLLLKRGNTGMPEVVPVMTAAERGDPD